MRVPWHGPIRAQSWYYSSTRQAGQVGSLDFLPSEPPFSFAHAGDQFTQNTGTPCRARAVPWQWRAVANQSRETLFYSSTRQAGRQAGRQAARHASQVGFIPSFQNSLLLGFLLTIN